MTRWSDWEKKYEIEIDREESDTQRGHSTERIDRKHTPERKKDQLVCFHLIHTLKQSTVEQLTEYLSETGFHSDTLTGVRRVCGVGKRVGGAVDVVGISVAGDRVVAVVVDEVVHWGVLDGGRESTLQDEGETIKEVICAAAEEQTKLSLGNTQPVRKQIVYRRSSILHCGTAQEVGIQTHLLYHVLELSKHTLQLLPTEEEHVTLRKSDGWRGGEVGSEVEWCV
jgi:hypothetical protein